MSNQEVHKTGWWLPVKINLLTALLIAILAATGLVAVAYTLYWNDSNRKYDIARGGEKVNQALSVEDDQADTTSPADAPATKQKLEYLNKEINALRGLGQFNQEDLSDQNIQLLPSDQPSR